MRELNLSRLAGIFGGIFVIFTMGFMIGLFIDSIMMEEIFLRLIIALFIMGSLAGVIIFICFILNKLGLLGVTQ